MFMGETLNFFAVICFFIFIGLGLDYCVFHWHARRHSREVGRAVWYSFLTSLVAFGLLGFTEFAVTRLMGITLAAGLAVAYLAAKLCCGITGGKPSPLPPHPSPRSWHEQEEQCGDGTHHKTGLPRPRSHRSSCMRTRGSSQKYSRSAPRFTTT